jgi:hypothetical protein
VILPKLMLPMVVFGALNSGSLSRFSTSKRNYSVLLAIFWDFEIARSVVR